MIFNILFNNFFIQLRSFSLIKIIELYILDIDTASLYFKVIVCNDTVGSHPFDNDYCDVNENYELHQTLYGIGSIMKTNDTMDTIFQLIRNSFISHNLRNMKQIQYLKQIYIPLIVKFWNCL